MQMLRYICLGMLFIIDNGLLYSGDGHSARSYWIFLRDKGPVFSKQSPAPEDAARVAGLSDRSIQRRMRNMKSEPIAGPEDLPVYRGYRDVLDRHGLTVRAESRWLNAVSVSAAPGAIGAVRELPFVKEIRPVSRMSRPDPIDSPEGELFLNIGVTEETEFSYGPSAAQISLHKIDLLHNLGITGGGAAIGFLDTGFEWTAHEAFQHVNVLGSRDFVAENYPDEVLSPFHYSHGTVVFSVTAGFSEGNLIGVAPHADFLLAATEDVRSETPAEEDFWVEGLEWMESLGVDIVSTSLGYSLFDDGFPGYTPEDMDGKTAVTTIAAEMAYARGVLIVASAGNEGGQPWRIITTPADGEHVVAVGAILSGGDLAQFSSRGPTADGRIKPDVTALGVNVFGASTTPGQYRTENGTSLSAPIVSGTAGLILSARPYMSAGELRNSLRLSAGSAMLPDNDIGWGLIDAQAMLAFPVLRDDGHSRRISMFLTAAAGLHPSVDIFMRSAGDESYTVVGMQPAGLLPGRTSGNYEVVIPEHISTDQGFRFFAMVVDSAGIPRRYPADPAAEYFLPAHGSIVELREAVPPERFAVHQNFPNPFNDRTILRYEIPDVSNVTVDVFNILGKHIVTLIDGPHAPGVHEVEWNAAIQPSGVYFFRISYGNRTETGKMVLVR